jgi:signal transduction histidine kinase
MNSPMKPFFIILSICLIVLSSCGQETTGRKQPVAKNSVLDLRGWNFDKDGIVNLNGEWEFYWNEFISPDDFKKKGFKKQSGYMSVPTIWDDFIFQGKKVEGAGYATYRVRINLDNPNQILALKLLPVSTAYKLWINGKLSASAGIIGKSREKMSAEYLPQVAAFALDSNQLDIVIQVSNFFHRDGGIWYEIELGSEKQITEKRNRIIAIELFIVGSLIIMALYHFGLFFLRRSDPSPLFFGVICLLWSLNALVTGETVFAAFLPGMDFRLLLRVEYLSLFLSIPLFSFFLICLFPKEFHRRVMYVTVLYFTFVTVFILTMPEEIFTHTATPTQISMAIFGFYAVYVFIAAYRNGQKEAGWFLVGTIVFMITIINDILYNHYIIKTGDYRSFGLFIFILSQSFVLSSRFSKAFFKIEDISCELGEKNKALQSMTTKLESLNLSLESKVSKRTEELSLKHSQMKELLHVLCHDLSNPLASIQGILELKDEDPELFQEMFKFIELSVDNSIGIIDTIREMEALEEGKLQIRTYPYTMLNLVEESQAIMSRAIKLKNLTININCDPAHITQVEKTSFVNSVLNNILSNAIKFSHADSSIDISSERSKQHIILRVKDYGIGIPGNILQDLFNISKATNRKGTNGESGTGFGMPQVKKFVTLYGGRMEITSQTESEKSSESGTEVSLYLPAANGSNLHDLAPA